MCNKKQKLPQTSSQHSTTWNLSLERHQQWHSPAKEKNSTTAVKQKGESGEAASKIDSQLTSTKVLKWISFHKFPLFIYFSLWHFFIACGAKSSPAARDKFSQQAFHRDKSHLREIVAKKPVAWATRKSELERGWKLGNFARLFALEILWRKFLWLPPPQSVEKISYSSCLRLSTTQKPTPAH